MYPTKQRYVVLVMPCTKLMVCAYVHVCVCALSILVTGTIICVG